MQAYTTPALGAGYRLDPPPKSDTLSGGFCLTVYPTAGEATISEYRESSQSDPTRARTIVQPGSARREELDAQHNARARGHVRRYCVANRCRYLWTLTYAGDGQHDWAEGTAQIATWLRTMKRLTGARPILAVAEWHPQGHGLHFHVALATFVPWQVVVRSWPHGSVQTPRVRGLTWQGMNPRNCARYCAKYVGKALGDGRPAHAHRYWCAHGWQPEVHRIILPIYSQALDCLEGSTPPGPLRLIWTSDSDPNWRGPRIDCWRFEPTGPPLEVSPTDRPNGERRRPRKWRLHTPRAELAL
jgi:hypothetical protein